MKTKILCLCLAAALSPACGALLSPTKSADNSEKAVSNESGNVSAVQTVNKIPFEPEATPNAVNAAGRKNLLALGNGSFPVEKTSEYSGRWRAISLVDELASVGWASAKTKTSNQSVTIELAAKTIFKSLIFDTAQVDEDGTAAKDISVEISDTSATGGFQEILMTTLKDKTDGQEFAVKQTGGRWLRLNIKNNYGSPNYIEVMEMRGYGEQETPAPLENVSGTYESSYGKFHIKHEGTSIVGCYEVSGGLLEGGVENRVMKLTWSEHEGNRVGPALMFFAQDGTQFLGVWADNNSTDGFPGEWNGKKISEKVGNCEHLKTLETNNATGNKIEETLEKTGRAVVYGINFDFNSDAIKNESKPTLDQIAAVLTENKTWKMTVEGHTDNVGGDAFNKTLSDKRANAVKSYLTGKGIEAARLSASGIGMSKPIAQNATEAGRAQNRRVELVKN